MNHDHWDCGLHSGIPECCIRWAAPCPYNPLLDYHHHRLYVPRDRDGRRLFWKSPKNWAGLSIYGQFIPCPNHLRAPPRVRVRACPNRVRFSIWLDQESAMLWIHDQAVG